jgi:hypothetical protein
MYMENNYDLTLYSCARLKVSTGQIRPAGEYSIRTIEKPIVGTYFAIGFYFFNIVVEYLKQVQNSIALTVQDCLITNVIRGSVDYLVDRSANWLNFNVKNGLSLLVK